VIRPFVQADLTAASGSTGIVSRVTDPFAPAPGSSSARRRRRLVIEIVGVLVLLGVAVAVILTRGGGKEDLGSDPELARELLAMEQADQDARNASIDAGLTSDRSRELGEEILRVDRRNAKRLKEIIDEHGWPGRSLVGDRASRSAWLIAQHADHDPKFQKRVLELMEAMPDGEVEESDAAYLTDRVLVAEGKPQRYGTQFECRKGELVPRTPINDEDTVDERRADVGMQPLDEYKASFKDVYGDCPEDD
jgi:hypothetical protein